MTDFDVMMIGNFAKDKLIVDGVEEIASGGGVYYGSVVVKRLGYNVVVVTRLHPDDFPRLVELKEEGIEVFATSAEGTSGIANFYQSSDMERRICKPLGFGGKYNLNEIPDLKTNVIMLSPLFSGEIDLALLQALSHRAPVGMDIQGFVRVPVEDGLIFQPWTEIEEGLQYVTLLKVDKAEAEFLTGLTNPYEAAKKLHAMGPKEIVLTQSSGVTVFADGVFYEAPFTPRSLAGRTGRGDTCFSTYIAMRQSENPETACRWAGIITSLKQEVPGPWKGTKQQVIKILDQ
ncbi:MAG: carbohydrate kinase [Chloroflexi bacterium HGW-Chloroflexi-10]|nr:MAG: carbohydrate kinase [Chloroflexi bacterium HGW-Chloroflexi-10]